LTPERSEQGKLPAAKEFRLAERDKYMSEQKQSFMQQLDLWTEDNILRPLFGTDPNQNDWQGVEEQVKNRAKEGGASETPAPPPACTRCDHRWSR
jgi:hypothetical protein